MFSGFDQLWYKYIHMVEMLTNYSRAWWVFQRWMDWPPDDQRWLSYIRFKLWHGEILQARKIFKKFVHCHHKIGQWIWYDSLR